MKRLAMDTFEFVGTALLFAAAFSNHSKSLPPLN
jgi:hypothetical protein